MFTTIALGAQVVLSSNTPGSVLPPPTHSAQSGRGGGQAHGIPPAIHAAQSGRGGGNAPATTPPSHAAQSGRGGGKAPATPPASHKAQSGRGGGKAPATTPPSHAAQSGRGGGKAPATPPPTHAAQSGRGGGQAHGIPPAIHAAQSGRGGGQAPAITPPSHGAQSARGGGRAPATAPHAAQDSSSAGCVDTARDCVGISPADCKANRNKDCANTCASLCSLWEEYECEPDCSPDPVPEEWVEFQPAGWVPNSREYVTDGMPFWPAPPLPYHETQPVAADQDRCGNVDKEEMSNDWTGYTPTGVDQGALECVEGHEDVTLEGLTGMDLYHAIGINRLGCAGWGEDFHESARYMSQSNANCDKAGTNYDAFAKAIGMFPDFISAGTLEKNQLELAAFLAHTSVETSGAGVGNPAFWGWSWCYTGEVGVDPANYGSQVDNNCMDYLNPKPTDPGAESPDFGYFGRGLIQLTHCYNYNSFDHWLNLNSDVAGDIYLLDTPSFVQFEEPWAWASALWFWMSPSNGNSKPSMHSVASLWEMDMSDTDLAYDNAGRKLDFGYQVNILNGGLECGTMSAKKARFRLDYFMAFLQRLGYEQDSLLSQSFVSITGGCSGVRDMGVAPFSFAVIGTSASGLDTVSQSDCW